MPRQRAIAVAGGAVLALASRTAGAQPVSLRYASVPSCPSESAFEGLVRAHTARAEFAPDAERWFEVTLERRGPRWGGTLRVRTAGEPRASVRYLEGGSCEEAAAGLALVAALAIDPNASTSPGAPAQAAASSPSDPSASPASPAPSASAATEVGAPASPTSVPPPAPAAPALPVEPPLPTERATPRPAGGSAVAEPHEREGALVFLGADIELAAAVAPAPLLGAAVFAEIDARRGAASPSLRVTLAFASSSPFAGPSPVANYLLGVARASACPVGFAFGANLGALPCVEAGAGLVHASGLQIAHPEVADTPWAEVGATAVLRWAPGERVFVDAAGGVLVPITQPKFVFLTPQNTVQTTVYQVQPVGPMASLAVGARFW